jgi:tetratricopeptide (TPR) repeat protein
MKLENEKKIRPRWNHWMFHVDAGAAAPERVLRWLAKPQTDFEIAFLEDILAAKANHLETMRLLADLYTRNGQYREGLEMDRRIVVACPRDSLAHYNLACSLSLTGRLDECFAVLRQAIRLGYRDIEHMTDDPDLEAAHNDPRWVDLVLATQV